MLRAVLSTLLALIVDPLYLTVCHANLGTEEARAQEERVGREVALVRLGVE